MRSMAHFDFEGKRVPLQEGDSIAAALYRTGVRTFNRSLKYHRRRGLYCVTGDCPNCLCTVDGEPGVRSCNTPAEDGMRVKRETGWPNAERDLLSVADKAGHRFMPVGFYYKVFTKPKAAWELAEKVIRRATGVGTLPVGSTPQPKPSRHAHTDVLVIGAGVAGLAAALAAAEGGDSVIIVDEGAVGEKVAPGPTLDRINALRDKLRDTVGITLLERHTAIGIYDGGMVPVVGPDALMQIEPERIVVAAGAVEAHAVFAGNDLPGIFLGRGAARLAGVHGVAPGNTAVVAFGDPEGAEHLKTLRACGVEIAAAVVPTEIADLVPVGVTVLRDGKVVSAEGRKHLSAVVVETPTGVHTLACDTLVLSLGLAPRDGLLRMATIENVSAAGDVIWPGCSLDEAAESATEAGAGGSPESRDAEAPPMGSAGYVCLCEDVAVKDLSNAWDEGWRSSEILKRYTTATMGPCQGAMCGRHLAAFAAAGSTAKEPRSGARTTARPPARAVRLEDLAGAVHEVIEKRTALHDEHVAMGARVDWSGSWKRPYNYGDTADEYRAVRERVSLMDVSTLGKFLIAGSDAQTLADRVYSCRIEGLEPGRSRYMLALDEAGYVMDDGLVCAVEDGRFYVTSTSGGADRMESGLRNWADRWGLDVHIVNQTAMLGAINVCGPHARDVLAKLSGDPLDAGAFPYASHRQITVAGVPCRAIRVGFVGELSYELHHPRSRSVELWRALVEAGADFGLRPHGLDTLDLLRLEKGHMYLLQDTLPDDHPAKLGLDWAVGAGKSHFVGKMALERMGQIPVERKMIGLEFDSRPQRGAPLYLGHDVVGRVTSCAHSPALGKYIGLGWLRAVDGAFPTSLRAVDVPARVVPTPFYDREGAKLRA